jgi:hypothetical protein
MEAAMVEAMVVAIAAATAVDTAAATMAKNSPFLMLSSIVFCSGTAYGREEFY